MSAEHERRTNEDFTTAISGFYGIEHMRGSEAEDGIHAPRTRKEGPRRGRGEIARGLPVLADGESEKPHGGLKLPLVRLDPHHGGLDSHDGRLDLPLFQSDQRHLRADQPQFQSAEQHGGLKNVRVRPNQQRVGLEMWVVESDARELQSVEQFVRLNLAHVESDASGFQSDVSRFQSDALQVESDELLVGLKDREVGLDVSEFRLKQPLVRLAVTKVGLKILLFRLKQWEGGLKVCGIQSDESEIQSAMSRFQSRG
jgi:hypothetical protein